MPSLRLNVSKALKDFEKSRAEIVKQFKLEKVANIHKDESKHQRNLFVDFLRNHWTKYIERQKW